MNARAATLAALLVVAGSTLAVAGVNPAVAQSTPGPSAPGSEPPEETADGATFTVSTQSIDLHQSEGGTICAQKLAPDVNEVTITHATMNGVELYLGNEEEPKKVSSPTAKVDEIVLYTNGENQLVNLLATTGACIPLDQPQQTVLEVYYQEAGQLQMDQFQFETGGTSPPPEPGGFTVPESLLNDSSSTDGPVSNATEGLNATTDAVGDATDTVQRVTDAVDGSTPTGAVDRVNETTENVTETVEGVQNPTGTVNDTLETVNGTTGTVTDTVGDTTGTVDDTAETVNETVDDPTGAVDGTTETVDSATDAVDNTTSEVGDTVEDTGDTVSDPPENGSEATTEVRDAVGDTRDTVENTTTEVGDTVDDTRTAVDDTTGDTQETVEDTTGDTQTAVEDTTTEVRTTVEEVVPPTAGFGLPVDVPLVGEQIPLDASKSADSDGEIAKYEWDLDGDGNFEKTGERVTHAFSSPGEKQVTLRVTDADGATDTATKTVTVNAPPEAAFSVLSDLLTIGEPISLDATKSADPDGEIAKYEWDLDGDGNYEQTGATPSPTFDSLGSHEIGLRVTDDRGATDTTTKTIDLTESDDGGLLSGSSDGGSTTTDSGDTTTDGGGSTTTDDGGIDIIGTLLP